jgi:hypothetical protein
VLRASGLEVENLRAWRGPGRSCLATRRRKPANDSPFLVDPRRLGGILYLRSNRIVPNFPSTGNLFLLSSGVVRALRGALRSLDLLENGVEMGGVW